MKKFVLALLLAFGALGTSGCFSIIDWEHNLNHLRIWNNNLDNMHRDIDYFFFDYDWNDPTGNTGFESPNTR
ncbi:MAG: hypothetical protein HUU29_08055 [Planctomycetaceae bacterium]|nr:hypothetical protein [Planctomycetaceae bacterium]